MNKQESRVNLTAGRVEAFTCQPDKAQAFLWDTDTPTLALRVTPSGRKTYVFESRLNGTTVTIDGKAKRVQGSTIRVNIGTAADWPIKQARTEAQRLKMLVDAGSDPRELEREKQAAAVEKKAAAAAKVEAAKVQALTVPSGPRT